MSGHVRITGPDGSVGHPERRQRRRHLSRHPDGHGRNCRAFITRGLTGEGQFCDVGMYDGMLAFAETVLANYGYAQQELPARGQHHPNLMPFGLCSRRKTAASPLQHPGPATGTSSARRWSRPDLIDDERTKNTFIRRKNQDFVEERHRCLDP